MSLSRARLERVPEPEVMDDDSEAVAYEEGDFRRVNSNFVRRLLRAVDADSGRALDLGTGPAEIPVLFCERAPNWRVTAVDASPAMLELARRKVADAGLSGRIRLREADAKTLAGLRGGFDLVFSNSLLHHLHDPIPFWRQVRRCARRGGQVVIQDLRRPASRREAEALVRRHAADDSPLLRQLFHQSLLAAFTPAEVREQLREAGWNARGCQELAVRATTDRHLVISGGIADRD